MTRAGLSSLSTALRLLGLLLYVVLLFMVGFALSTFLSNELVPHPVIQGCVDCHAEFRHALPIQPR